MVEVVCIRCGFNEATLVRKEMFADGKYSRKWRCPRCSMTWSTVAD